MSIRSKNLVIILCLLILVSFPMSGLAEQAGLDIKSIYFSVSEQYQLYEPKPTAGETISLRPGGNVLLYPRAIYTNGEDKLISDVVWKISDPQVVSIDQDFMLKGIKEGTATVAASYGSHTVSVEVAVNPVVQFLADLYPTDADIIKEDGTVTVTMNKDIGMSLTLNAFHASGVKENVSRVAKWESKNPDVAYIAATGNPLKGDVTLLSFNEGETEITASLNGLTQKFEVRVGPNENRPTENVADQITVKINGVAQVYDQPPVIMNGRTLVPLRGIFEALGANVSWDGQTQTVTATKGGTTIQLKIGSAIAYKNDAVIYLDQSSMLINDRTMAPVRFVSEALGAKVDWDEIIRTVSITK